jgi:hypothetical protein
MLLALLRDDVSALDGPYRSSNPSPSSFVLVEPSFHSTISQVAIMTFFYYHFSLIVFFRYVFHALYDDVKIGSTYFSNAMYEVCWETNAQSNIT